jgi:hypothetical protein
MNQTMPARIPFPDGSPERQNGITNLRTIRAMLARRDFFP